MRITIIGSGYVGLVSGACFADYGHYVTCVDLDEKKISDLKNGKMPIYEPSLADLVRLNVEASRLSFTTNLPEAMVNSQVVFIAVGTPSRRGDGHADLSYVYDVAKSIARNITGYLVVVTKSTVPVGTGDEVERIIRTENPKANFSVVSNPEFLREGAAISDFKKPDRVIIGSNDSQATSVMQEIYRPLARIHPLVFMSRRSSELTKYAANAFLAVKLTYINEISDLCEKTGAKISDVVKGIGLDRRIGAEFLKVGPGYGGSCFPKDTLALSKMASDNHTDLNLVNTTISSNEKRKLNMVKHICNILGKDLKNKTIAILGLAFKENTDDMREAPSITIINKLQEMGANIRTYDPEAMDEARKILKNIVYCRNAYETVEGCDLVILVTEWEQFRALDLKKLVSLVAQNNFLDLRNTYTAYQAKLAGFNYYQLGNG